MSKTKRLKIALCWHMHQPWYQEGSDGEYRLPWVYLHAMKDYSDMAAHLEAHPGMKLTVNFAPVLLDQLDDYARRLEAHLADGTSMNDPLLNLLAGVTPIPADIEGRMRIFDDCQKANADKMIHPYPAYHALLASVKDANDSAPEAHFERMIAYLGEQYFIDLLVWYHLAWLGHSMKQLKSVHQLIGKEAGYTMEDRRTLLKVISDCIGGLVPRYRALSERGQVELSMTPYFHPIVPLLNDIDNMACSQPDDPRPEFDLYPGGVDRAHWHFQEGLDCFERHFGDRPTGVWLSEGGLSEDALVQASEYGFRWTASGEAVLRNSLAKSTVEGVGQGDHCLYHPYVIEDVDTRMMFRDDGLSDLIGFEYSNRHSEEAAADLIGILENIADGIGKKAGDHVVNIILDGENAWEYYPHNGHFFLDHLYSLLSDNTKLEPVRMVDAVEACPSEELEKLCAGSWVYGSFSTWIGSKDKNRAWDLLYDAKLAYDSAMSSGRLDAETSERATRQLAIAEGSDWFWWFGDYNPGGSVRDFDELYRSQLVHLYQLLGEDVPDTLDQPVSLGGGDGVANAGTMVRNV